MAFGSSVSYIQFVNELKKYADKTIPGVERVQFTKTNAKITFVNGSCVEMFITTDNVRGRKCNELLYEDGLSEEILNMVLR